MPAPDLSFIPSLPTTTGDAKLDAYTGAGLTALKAPINPMYGSDAFKNIQSLLAPGADGGLSPALMAMFKNGTRTNAMTASSQASGAMSDAVGRGLEGSTVEAHGVDNARFGESMANSNLMASLFGQQNQNNNAMAGFDFNAQNADNGQVNARLEMLMHLLSGAGDSAANMDMFNTGMSNSNAQAEKTRNAQMIAAIMSGAGAAVGGYMGGR